MLKKSGGYAPDRYITREEFTQYVDRGKEGFERINYRLKSLETMEDKMHQLIASIEKMSSNVEHMLKGLEKQERRIDEHDVRLDDISAKGSKKWDNISEHIWKYIAAAIVGYVLFKAGVFQVP